MRCMIWYYLHNLKTVKTTHGGELLSEKLQATATTLLKVKILHDCFSRCINCYKWYQIAQSILYNKSLTYSVEVKKNSK